MHDDPYILEDMIACGPSAKVYRGHDLSSEKTVRLKVLMDNHVSCPVDHAAISVLAPTLVSLRHPHVSALLELNVHGDDVTLVAEFAAGVNLWTFLHQQRPLTAKDVKALASQLVMALEAGEAMQLVHGDVKPSNVIIADDMVRGYTLQLQDWGEAACRRYQPLETLNYRAPELLLGAGATVAGDLFSAGATLATLLLGHAPVHGGPPAQLQAAWSVFDPVVLRQRRPDLEPALHEWLACMLSYDPAGRPPSAREALRMLALAAKEEAEPILPVRAPVLWPPTLMAAPGREQSLPPEARQGAERPALPQRKRAAGTAEGKSKPPSRQASRRAMVLGFNLAAMAALGGYFLWLTQRSEPAWTNRLRQAVAEKLEALAH